MPKSKPRRNRKSPNKSRVHRPARRDPEPPSISELVDIVMRGDDIFGEEDPLIAEIWASAVLGTFYKVPAPMDVRLDFEKSWNEGLIDAFTRAEGPKQLAILRAVGAVAEDPIASAAQDRAEALSQSGVKDPSWTSEIGKAEFVDAFVTEDPYGDQRAYYTRFQYPGREPHTLCAMYDVNLGGIVKDSFAGYTKGDLRFVPMDEDGLRRFDPDPKEMATEILRGIAMGDMFLDNDWTEDYKKARALLLCRMKSIQPQVPDLFDDKPTLSETKRKKLVREFRESGLATNVDDEDSILQYCLDFKCDYTDGDPLRWSPIGVELFMMDYLPRKVALEETEIRDLPAVLRAWVRFTLSKRGLEERWIEETEAAVDELAPEFREAVTNPDNFGIAKAMVSSMIASGVDPTDQQAIDEWVEEFNRRPFEERDEFLRDR